MKGIYRLLLLCVLSLTLLLPLSGCGGKADMTFTTILPANVNTLDPQAASRQSEKTVIGSIFEGLCRIDEEGKTVPGVANRWDHNRDYTEFTFHLRSKARWSDGSPVTAADFIYGVLRALRGETGAVSPSDLFLLKNARAIYNGQAAEETLGLYAKDDRTLVAELETGCPDFPAFTARSHYMPCSQEYFEESAGHYGLSAEYLLTNGPFTFPNRYAWSTDYNEEKITLVRSDTYRGERTTVAQGLVYLIDYDDIVEEDPVAALTGGTVDLLEVTEANAMALEEQDCQVLALEDAVTGLLLNPQCDALDYVTTREIFLRTIDRQELLKLRPSRQEAPGIMASCVQWDGEAYYGEGDSAYTSQNDEVTQQIPSLLELLEIDSMPSITVLCPDDEDSIAVANQLLTFWNSKLGNAFNIHPMPEEELRQQVLWDDYDAALYTLRAGGTTPYSVLSAFESTASPQLADFSSYDEVLSTLPFNFDACRQLEQTLLEEYVFYPLFSARSYYALAPGVSNVAVSPDQRLDFSQARKK